MRSTNHRVRTGLVGLIAVVALSIGMPAVAGAQQVNGSTGPTGDQYDPPVVQVENAAGGGGNEGGSALADPVGGLQFTGFDVIAMLAQGRRTGPTDAFSQLAQGETPCRSGGRHGVLPALLSSSAGACGSRVPRDAGVSRF